MTEILNEIHSWKELSNIDSPLINQYMTFKKEHSDMMVFFQVGEFYEIYCEDAHTIHRELEDIKLTGRTVQGNRIAMCGVPAHAGDFYANHLAKKGYSILFIANEKGEDGSVERKKDKIITPGTIVDEEFLSKDDNQYVMTAYFLKDELGVVLLDTMSGELITRTVNKYGIFDIVQRYQPKEVLLYLSKEWEEELMKKVHNIPRIKTAFAPYYEFKELFEEHRDAYFGEQFFPYTVVGAHYFMISYLNKVQPKHVSLRPLNYILERDYMYLHASAISGLELLENNMEKKKKGSLFDLLDRCRSAKGSRMLKKWIQEPLISEKKIFARYQGVEFFTQKTDILVELQDILSQTKDIERSLARFETGKVKDVELGTLLETLETYHSFLEKLDSVSTINWMKATSSRLKVELEENLTLLRGMVSPADIIARGFDTTFDEIREQKEKGMQWIEEYVEEEKNKTGIKNLKFAHNSVLGYYLEVTKSHWGNVPEYFSEQQSLANAKRYSTDKFTELKVKYLEALEKYDSMYRKVLLRIVSTLLKKMDFYRNLIDFIALVDVLMSFAEVSNQYGYKKPVLVEQDTIRIENGLHPLLQAFGYGKTIGNPCSLMKQEIQIITGPNMGGKSTYLKMIGLLTIMAQIGCFVPARFAFKPMDRVLLRMGANDYMLNNQSTFMVEMEEVAYIVYHATENSLILMDELGRGTSTNDGIAIAHSVIRYIHNNIKAKTVCSTHYHELTELEQNLRFVKNYHAEAIETADGVELTFKIKPGGSQRSFGIQVAKKAGLPNEIIQLAEQLLND